MTCDVYPGSQIRIFSIPDPGSGSETLEHHPSMIFSEYRVCLNYTDPQIF